MVAQLAINKATVDTFGTTSGIRRPGFSRFARHRCLLAEVRATVRFL
ncbi:hypothetical protein MELA_02379 [Candidatus Methylomirabilis lanthanidiphila]|uniref:Uncharacterized protein n=1 Tax=Candidatus Methylomirabilis lanthanidiphila TaxID=2211376 RepID=A0A564ZKX4_9BACT|nr:hypothetical protein MELA_02379 [Candidatus Methylomirabilis lanthanidiphila]